MYIQTTHTSRCRSAKLTSIGCEDLDLAVNHFSFFFALFFLSLKIGGGVFCFTSLIKKKEKPKEINMMVNILFLMIRNEPKDQHVFTTLQISTMLPHSVLDISMLTYPTYTLQVGFIIPKNATYFLINSRLMTGKFTGRDELASALHKFFVL